MNARRRRDLRPAPDHLDGRILLSASPFSPSQIKQAYSENYDFNVNGKSYAATGAGQTIAIIVAGLDPNIGNDLATFDETFGLAAPPSFQDVYFQGAQNHESASWITETSLDVEWAHAVAPQANILLVQAVSSAPSDYATAINWARDQPGVSVVSMSYGTPESSAYSTYNSLFTTPAGHTGVTFVAASGDYGYYNSPAGTHVGVLWPADVPTVLSVGGTTLSTTSNGTYVGESAWSLSDQGSNGWSGSGGGYSQVYKEPSYQEGVQKTGVRTVPDVAYDANPSTGYWVYNASGGGWEEIGGTSAGAPQWAALIAEANQGRALAGLKPLDGASQTLPTVYANASAFRDVTTGSNGYSAARGYDLATGLGTPLAYVVAGDLAFHATTSATASVTVTVAADRTPGDSSAVGIAPLLIGTDSEGGHGPFARPTADRDADGASTPESLLIALPPADGSNVAASIGRRHDTLDRALGALIDEDPASLRS